MIVESINTRKTTDKSKVIRIFIRKSDKARRNHMQVGCKLQLGRQKSPLNGIFEGSKYAFLFPVICMSLKSTFRLIYRSINHRGIFLCL